VIAWEDHRSGNSDVYAQRYNSSGVALDTNVKINTNAGSSSQWWPSVSCDPSGNYVISWEDYRNGNADIYAQRFNSSGAAAGVNFRVNIHPPLAGQIRPAVAKGPGGGFLAAWEDYRNSAYPDIYARVYDSAGTAAEDDFKANYENNTNAQYNPTIAMDSSGNFVISWIDRRGGTSYDIYAQRYSSSGAAVDTNFKVNTDAGTADQYNPAISSDAAGNFVISWQDSRSGTNSDIYAQRYSSSGAAVDTNFKVNTDAGTAFQYDPSISSDAAGNFVVAWRDIRDGNDNIYAQRFDSSGAALGTNFKANDDVGTTQQVDPAVSMDKKGIYVIVWDDRRNGSINPDIYAQRYDSSGTALGANFKVNTDAGTAFQIDPSISSDAAGNFVITWFDYRNGNADIYAQRYSSSGAAVDTNFKVNTDAGTADQAIPSISSDAAGNFVISWYDYRNGNADVYAQRYSSSGAAVDTNFKVNTDAGTADQAIPSISSDAAGNFVITWDDLRNVIDPFSCFFCNDDIYARWFESSCSAIPGDANASFTLTLADIIATVNYLFNKPGWPVCGSGDKLCWLSEMLCRGDWDASGTVTLSDVVRGVNKLFNKPGGPWDALPSGLCCQPLP
jgi:hypothetical protein